MNRYALLVAIAVILSISCLRGRACSSDVSLDFSKVVSLPDVEAFKAYIATLGDMPNPDRYWISEAQICGRTIYVLKLVTSQTYSERTGKYGLYFEILEGRFSHGSRLYRSSQYYDSTSVRFRLVDLNSDDKPELVCISGDEEGSVVQVLEFSKDLSVHVVFSTPYFILNDELEDRPSYQFKDVDGDGLLELVVNGDRSVVDKDGEIIVERGELVHKLFEKRGKGCR